MPQGIEWPTCNGTRLGFLARLSLAELRQAAEIDWLPATGALLFFYDLEQQPWGYDPGDRGRWAVLLVDDLDRPATADDALSDDGSDVPFRYVHFRAIRSLPSTDREVVKSLALNDAESEEWICLTDAAFEELPRHQIGGFPSPVQSDEMELEAQLVSHGLYCGNASGYNDPRADSLRPGAAAWRLLFQFDSDEDLRLMWGDAGTLYYWVPEAQARQRNFEKTWLVLQCC